ncbi:CPBP family intramembrane glutamic endopeptidase [Halobellus sp. EA9]|uniref:CPBP family intramembrane glutamic endopeptidase n=1 Tax=Halobellus sp. EA9 TaxID=3421647 RepID=UPI003EB8EB80
MNVLGGQSIPFDMHRIRALVVVALVPVIGVVAGYVGVSIEGALSGILGFGEQFSTVSTGGSQIGFGLLAGAYLWHRDDADRFWQFDVPSVRGIGWIVAVPILDLIVEPGEMALLNAVGLTSPFSHAGPTLVMTLLASPGLILPALVLLFLLYAPAEELLFRGIVHERLRTEFSPVVIIGIGAVVFGVLHGFFGLLEVLLTSGMDLNGALYWAISSGTAGILLGLAYERTRNVMVPAFAHALLWLEPAETVVTQLLSV